MKKLYFECYSGISGDMTVGALIDLGVDKAYLFSELSKLGLSGYTPTVQKVMKNGIGATKFSVVMEDGSHDHEHHEQHDHPAHHEHSHAKDQMGEENIHAHDTHDAAKAHETHEHAHTHGLEKPHTHDGVHFHTHAPAISEQGHTPIHPHEHTCDGGEAGYVHGHEHPHHHEGEGHTHVHTGLSDITNLIETSGITDGAKKIAVGIFKLLAKAEAKVHQTTVDEIHFHEVGAVDSIVDIVSAAICIDAIKPDYIACSVLYEGTGYVRCQHGIVPVPAPATAELLRAAKAPLTVTQAKGEMITPTGAAIITYLAKEFGPMKDMNFDRIGVGAGDKDFAHANILRVYASDQKEKDGEDEVYLIQTNIDDCTPEQLGYTMQHLGRLGVKDAYYTPIYIKKKNRPAYMLSVICDESSFDKAVDGIFSETSSIGIRYHKLARKIMARNITSVLTKYGPIDVKESAYGEIRKSFPEYECVAKAAREHGVSFSSVYDAAKRCAYDK